MAVLKTTPSGYALWEYLPSQGLSIVFVVLFTLTTSFVIFRSIRTRTRFAIPFITGGIFEVIGYVGRIAAYNQTDQLGPYIIQSIFLLVAPALFAASIYMTLGRLMRSVNGERHSIIRVNWLTKAFVLGDVFSFFVQAAGGGLMASDSFSKDTAQDIILAGLFIQIIMFGLFAVCAGIFHVRMRKWPSAASMDPNSRWERIMGMLYGVSAMIMLRSIYRVVEYIMGQDGYLLQNEWPLYVFDAVPMFLTMAIFGWWYPGKMSPKAQDWEGVDSAPGTAMTMDTESQQLHGDRAWRK